MLGIDGHYDDDDGILFIEHAMIYCGGTYKTHGDKNIYNTEYDTHSGVVSFRFRDIHNIKVQTDVGNIVFT